MVIVSMRSIIIKDTNTRRLYWGETGLGLDWMLSVDDAWVYDTRAQAQVVFKAVRLAKQKAVIVSYDEVRKKQS